MTRQSWKRSSGILAAAVILAAGCQDAEEEPADDQASVDVTGSDDDQTDGTDDADGTEGDDLDGDGVDGADADDADDDGEQESPEPNTAWPDPISVDAVGRHAGGLVVEIFEVRSTGSSTDLDVRITNGQSIDASLNVGNQLTVLADDTETVYALVPPTGNDDLTVAAGEVLEGTLSFAGPLSEGATRLGLVINPSSRSAGQTGELPTPHLVIDDIYLDGSDGGGDDGDDDASELESVDDGEG